MAKFEVGDKARVKYIRNCKSTSWKVGSIVVIRDLVSGISERSGRHFDCTVICSDGSKAIPMFDQLEPIIQELSTWEEVQKLTNWNPKKVNHNV